MPSFDMPDFSAPSSSNPMSHIPMTQSTNVPDNDPLAEFAVPTGGGDMGGFNFDNMFSDEPSHNQSAD